METRQQNQQINPGPKFKTFGKCQKPHKEAVENFKLKKKYKNKNILMFHVFIMD